MRIGVFTGTIYEGDSYKESGADECVMEIDVEPDRYSNIMKTKERQEIRKSMTCKNCHDCKESRGEV